VNSARYSHLRRGVKIKASNIQHANFGLYSCKDTLTLVDFWPSGNFKAALFAVFLVVFSAQTKK